MIYVSLGLIFVVCLYFIALAMISRQAPEVGLSQGKLRICSPEPNCVCSEDPGLISFIEPITFQGPAVAAWMMAKNTIQAMGGTIEKEEGNYLWATFATRIFRFMDDVEIRIDERNSVIHIRSASRVGKSDMGTNSKRVEEFRERFGKGEK